MCLCSNLPVTVSKCILTLLSVKSGEAQFDPIKFCEVAAALSRWEQVAEKSNVRGVDEIRNRFYKQEG